MKTRKSFQQKRQETAVRLGIKPQQIPRHIAIIMDGNGRWAQKQGKPRSFGHIEGAKRVEENAVHCVHLGVEGLTLYSFSLENWKRPQQEIDVLMGLYTQYLVNIRPTLEKHNVKLLHIGKEDNLPKSLLKALHKTMELTAGNDGMKLGLALNYSGRDELIRATRDIAEEYKEGKLGIEDINDKCINDHLDTSTMPEVDLLVRTSGEMRVSNFLLWQISYAEFLVTDIHWPELNESQIEKAILEYAGRNRRFGMTDSQISKS